MVTGDRTMPFLSLGEVAVRKKRTTQRQTGCSEFNSVDSQYSGAGSPSRRLNLPRSLWQQPDNAGTQKSRKAAPEPCVSTSSWPPRRCSSLLRPIQFTDITFLFFEICSRLSHSTQTAGEPRKERERVDGREMEVRALAKSDW